MSRLLDVGDIYWQGDKRWGGDTLGWGQRTLGQAGCLVECMRLCAMALNREMAPPHLGEANKLLKTVPGAFLGSGMGPGRQAAALAMGLRFDAVEPFSAETVAARIALGQPTILGIDYRPGASSGESDADHFVVAVGVERERTGISLIHCADPGQGVLMAFSPLGFTYPPGRARRARFCEMRLLSRAQ